MNRHEQRSDIQEAWLVVKIVIAVLLFIVVLVGAGCWGIPRYGVYQQQLKGQAELRRAEQNRQIVVQEAIAKEEAAAHLGKAEVARAHGVAEANQIIGNSLRDNDAYLRYLWIHELSLMKEGDRIYIPTEANLPILEAQK